MKKILPVLFILAIVIIGLFFYKNKTPNTQNIETVEELTRCEKKMADENGKRMTAYEGIIKPVDFSSMPEAKLFYTRITETVKNGSNFAKHFTVVYWGCGTDCYGFSVVDVNTGKIIFYSPSNVDYHLRNDFGLDDTYLVLDPVNKGQERRYYKITQNGSDQLELICSEIAEEDMYGLSE